MIKTKLSRSQKFAAITTALAVAALYLMRRADYFDDFTYHWLFITAPLWGFWTAIWLNGWDSTIVTLTSFTHKLWKHRRRIVVSITIIAISAIVVIAIHEQWQKEERRKRQEAYLQEQHRIYQAQIEKEHLAHIAKVEKARQIADAGTAEQQAELYKLRDAASERWERRFSVSNSLSSIDIETMRIEALELGFKPTRYAEIEQYYGTYEFMNKAPNCWPFGYLRDIGGWNFIRRQPDKCLWED